jgi:hypothetical protein
MPLLEPKEEDVRKLHAEINQIGNQRFIVTTLALTFFAALLAIMIPKSQPWPEANFFFAISILLSIALFGLYLWSHLLKNTMRILTCYLEVTGKSSWEADWKKYRDKHNPSAHTKPQTLMFLTLNTFGLALAFILASYSTSTWSYPVVAIAIIFWGSAEILFCLGGFGDTIFNYEAQVRERWKALNK